jgi:hypothetical protein
MALTAAVTSSDGMTHGKRIGKETARSRYCPGVFLEDLRKTTKIPGIAAVPDEILPWLKMQVNLSVDLPAL